MARYDIYDGIISSGITLSSWNSMYISSGGVANNTTVKSYGSMYISSGGTANSTTVNSSGRMEIFSGGTATDIVAKPEAALTITVASDTYIQGTYAGSAFEMKNAFISGYTINAYGTMLICSGGVANCTTVNYRGSMYISSGGTANNTTVNYGNMYISSGGVANSTTVGGYMYISSGGTANSTTVNSSGRMYISSGGVANSTTVNSYGDMYIRSGGTATNVIWTPCVGSVYAADGAYVTYASTYSGVYFGSDNQLLSHTQSMSGKVVSGSMYVMSGGTANSTTVNSYGAMYISSGGTANSTTVNSGCDMDISSGGTANSTTVNSSGYMYISSGGVANNTTVSGAMSIHSGGTATNVIWTPCVGKVSAADGAYVTYASTYSGVYFGSNNQLLSHTQSMSGKVVSGLMYVMDGGVANSTTVNSYGSMYIYSGGTANSTTVNSYGYMYISSGGIANYTTVNSNGNIYISSGGTANYTTVNSDGYMYISSGGYATAIKENGGFVNVADGAYVSFASNTINGITLSYTSMTVHSNTVANDTTVNSRGSMYISSGGTASNTTVTGFWGKMNICSGGVANSTTVNSSGEMYIYSGGVHRGSLQIENGATVSAYSGAKIDFTVADRKTEDGYLINDLSLIQGTPTYTITVSTDQADGTYKLAQGANNFTGTLTIGNGTVDYGTITVNGADFVHNGVTYSLDQVSGNLTLTVSGGKSAAVDGDLDGNGLADVILVHTKQGYSGAWLTTGTSSVIKWGNLGNVNSKVELVGTGNVNGTSENGSDIIMKIGTTVAAWVTDGGKVKSYKELYTLKSNMNMLGIGDFDGDGVTDYLLRSTAGDLGYVTGDDNKWHYIKGLGKEWKISAVGDLDGDGCDDVIVRHDAGFTGAYMIDENGKITWSSLDTLKSDMTIVGTGDFNGDGVDDVLLQNKSNGWVGAWLVEDGRVDSFIGLCNNKNTIEQIADYNGDGIDDLRIRTEKGDIGVLYVNGADDTTWKYFQSVGTEWDTSFSALA